MVPAPTGNTVTTLSEINGALEYIREAETTAGVLFRTFCRQHMCMENWGFAVEAIAYEVRTVRAVSWPTNSCLRALNESTP